MSASPDDQLREQLEELLEEWNTYKKSVARLPSRRLSLCPSSSSSLPTTPTTTTSTYIAKSNFFDIIHDSPKNLVSSLQHPTTQHTSSESPSPASSPETKAKRLTSCSARGLLDELERAKDEDEDEKEEKDVPASSPPAVSETKDKRRAACSGRKLLDELELAKDDDEDEKKDTLGGPSSGSDESPAVSQGGGSDCSTCVDGECGLTGGGRRGSTKRFPNMKRLCVGLVVLGLAFRLLFVAWSGDVGFEERMMPT